MKVEIEIKKTQCKCHTGCFSWIVCLQSNIQLKTQHDFKQSITAKVTMNKQLSFAIKTTR